MDCVPGGCVNLSCEQFFSNKTPPEREWSSRHPAWEEFFESVYEVLNYRYYQCGQHWWIKAVPCYCGNDNFNDDDFQQVLYSLKFIYDPVGLNSVWLPTSFIAKEYICFQKSANKKVKNWNSWKKRFCQ